MDNLNGCHLDCKKYHYSGSAIKMKKSPIRKCTFTTSVMKWRLDFVVKCFVCGFAKKSHNYMQIINNIYE